MGCRLGTETHLQIDRAILGEVPLRGHLGIGGDVLAERIVLASTLVRAALAAMRAAADTEAAVRVVWAPWRAAVRRALGGALDADRRCVGRPHAQRRAVHVVALPAPALDGRHFPAAVDSFAILRADCKPHDAFLTLNINQVV